MSALMLITSLQAMKTDEELGGEMSGDAAVSILSSLIKDARRITSAEADPMIDAEGLFLIHRLSEGINDAMINHIYDEANGDVVPDDCGYALLHTAAEIYLNNRTRTNL
jgi:hypothetical protein